MAITINRTTSLDGAILPEYMPGLLYMNENQAHKFVITCTRGGSAVTLTGGITGRFMRADGQTILLSGSISSGKANLTLPQSCYIVPGRFTMAIFNVTGNAVTTIYAITGNVARTQTDTLVDPGNTVPTIDNLLAEIDAMRQATADAEAAATKAVRYDTTQSLTDAEKAKGRKNIDAAGVDDVDEACYFTSETGKATDNTVKYSKVTIHGLTLGKTLANSGGVNGQYIDAAYGTEDKRAASRLYYCAGDLITVSVLSGYKSWLDFYDGDYNWINSCGEWITGTKTFKSIGQYFRLLVAGDSSIAAVYEEIATIYMQSNVSELAGKVNSVYEQFGGQVALDGWVLGYYPNPTSGQIWVGSDYKYVPKVKVIGGAKYRYTGVFNSVCGAIFYDQNMTLISDAGTSDQIFTVPDNACYADIGTKGLSRMPELYCMGTEWDIEQSVNEQREIGFVEQRGAITPSLEPNQGGTGARADISVHGNECYLITGYTYVLNIYPMVIFLNGDTLISYDNVVSSAGGATDYRVYVPSNANRMIVNGKPNEIAIKRVIATVWDGVIDLYNGNKLLYNAGKKKIVWFGTSIPANGWFGYEHPNAYPQQVGRLLNAEVINEAIGSSCIHCKDPARITAANPYGFNPNFEASSRCLTNTQEEMDWICENWNSSIWTLNRPGSMDTWLENVIHSFGYEQMLDKYLTPSTFPDLFVFDHGFNDPSDTNNYFERYGEYNLYTFRGGMNFLIKRILDYNPYANIIIIGNYTTTRDVPEMQTAVATDWAIPIFKQWEVLGLSMEQNVTAYGYWSLVDGVYTWEDDSTAHTYSMRDRLVPDKVHPWSNPTGKILKKMAEIIAKWIISTNVFYEQQT